MEIEAYGIRRFWILKDLAVDKLELGGSKEKPVAASL